MVLPLRLPGAVPGQITVLSIDNQQGGQPDLAVFEDLLSPEERQRASRFHLPRIRDCFTVTRSALRLLLGSQLDVPPGRLQFRYGPNGKPSLDPPGRLCFNVSHSGRLSVFAFALDCELGVDVEEIRPLNDLRDVAERFFRREEADEVLMSPPESRTHAFYLCWTRKEAYIKAAGGGLSIPLDSFRVTTSLTDPARFVHDPDGNYGAAGWSLHDLRIDPEYAAALAYSGPERPVAILPTVDLRQLLSPPARE